MITSMRSFTGDVGELVDGVRASLGLAETALLAGTSTSRDLLGLQATLVGYQEDCAAFRADLDATDVTELLVVETGDRVITLWLAERGLRRGLVTLSGKLRESQELVDQLVSGRRRLTHVVRSGDTLQRIAARYLGSWQEWPRLLDANPTISAGSLPSGTVLVIPEKR